MKKTMKLGYFFVAAITAVFSACQSDPILEESLFIDEAQVAEIIKDGKLYDLDSLVSTFMTEVRYYQLPHGSQQRGRQSRYLAFLY